MVNVVDTNYLFLDKSLLLRLNPMNPADPVIKIINFLQKILVLRISPPFIRDPLERMSWR